MSMITIHNISKGQQFQQTAALRTGHTDSGSAMPMYLAIEPGEFVKVPNQSLVDWLAGTKQRLAEYMVEGILTVSTMNSTHIYQDKDHNCLYGLDYLVDAKFGELAQDHAIAVAGSLHTELNGHFNSIVHHNDVVGAIGGAAPTDLATLIVWIGTAQTQYAAHRLSVGGAPAAHPFADIVNTLTPVVAADWPTCIQALQELHRAYHSHKEWTLATTQISANAVLAY